MSESEPRRSTVGTAVVVVGATVPVEGEDDVGAGVAYEDAGEADPVGVGVPAVETAELAADVFCCT